MSWTPSPAIWPLTALTVTAGFATHAHFDHLLWHPGFGDAPRWASAAAAAIARADRKQLRAELGPEFPPKLGKLVGRVAPVPSTGLILDGPEPVELITHDGHAPGHTALWLPARRVLLAGDMLSDVEPPLPSYSDGRADRGRADGLPGRPRCARAVRRADRRAGARARPPDRPSHAAVGRRSPLDRLKPSGDAALTTSGRLRSIGRPTSWPGASADRSAVAR